MARDLGTGCLNGMWGGDIGWKKEERLVITTIEKGFLRA